VGYEGVGPSAEPWEPAAGGAEPEEDAAPGEQAALHERLHLHRAFASRYLPDARDLIVYRPPGYDRQPERRYPVLYLHDGQNLFDGRTSFLPGKTWQVREHADAAIEAGEVEPLLIVGIYNTGDRRLAEYTPDRDWRMGGGEADRYGLLLRRELMPWVERNYRVRTGPEATGMGGSSLGGLATLYLGLSCMECFGKLAVLSPSVWWNSKSILSYVRERARESPVQGVERPRIWLDVGDGEGQRTLENARQLARRLEAGGWRMGGNLHFEIVAGGMHDEPSWAQRVRPMLRFLFPAAHSAKP